MMLLVALSAYRWFTAIQNTLQSAMLAFLLVFMLLERRRKR